ncbi:MAG: YciI family protein [Bacteroidota bacterium]
MKTEQIFMMVFRFTPNPNYQPSAEERAEMKSQWGRFIGNLAISEKLVHTYQLGFEGKQVQADHSVNDGPVVADAQTLGGNLVLKAHSLEEATELAKDCPILHMGGSVEIRSIIPMAS